MSHHTSEILEWLEREGLITGDQHRRLARAVEGGVEVAEALRSVSIVEPMHYIRAMHGVGSGEPGAEDTSHDAGVTIRGVRLEGVTRDESEGVNVIELDLDPDLVPEPVADASHAPIEQRGGGEHGEIAGEASWFGMETDVSRYIEGAGMIPEHDLTADEEIGLVRELNELMSLAMAESGGFRIEGGEGRSARLWRMDAMGRGDPSCEMDADHAEALMARLRVMARIQPRAAGLRRGAFRVRRGRAVSLILLESEGHEGAARGVIVRAVSC